MTAIPDRRGDDVKLNALSARIDDLTAEHKKIATAVDQNTVITKRIEDNTAGLIEMWTAISGGLKVLNFLGKCAKWVTYIAGAIAAVYGAYFASKGGITP